MRSPMAPVRQLSSPERPDDAIVSVEGVSKIFRHRASSLRHLWREQTGTTIALSEFSLQVQRGRVMVLLGPNGSGKTTLLKLISTVLLPDAGRVLVGGFDTSTESA